MINLKENPPWWKWLKLPCKGGRNGANSHLDVGRFRDHRFYIPLLVSAKMDMDCIWEGFHIIWLLSPLSTAVACSDNLNMWFKYQKMHKFISCFIFHVGLQLGDIYIETKKGKHMYPVCWIRKFLGRNLKVLGFNLYLVCRNECTSALAVTEILTDKG